MQYLFRCIAIAAFALAPFAACYACAVPSAGLDLDTDDLIAKADTIVLARLASSIR
jgi:hypothetical protein